jgi:hypothetical protein
MYTEGNADTLIINVGGNGSRLILGRRQHSFSLSFSHAHTHTHKHTWSEWYAILFAGLVLLNWSMVPLFYFTTLLLYSDTCELYAVSIPYEKSLTNKLEYIMHFQSNIFKVYTPIYALYIRGYNTYWYILVSVVCRQIRASVYICTPPNKNVLESVTHLNREESWLIFLLSGKITHQYESFFR